MCWEAVWRLVLATAAWGVSFPTAKGLMALQAVYFPGRPDWFHAALVLGSRMALAAVIWGCVLAGRLRRMTRLEVVQGSLLGVWGAAGMIFQTHAQQTIPASTSAFFTQFTSVFIPAWIAWTSRRAPSVRVVCASGLVIFGCGMLSGVDWGGMGFGVGEWETVGAALFFTGQILVLERDDFRGNGMDRVALVMFGVKALIFWAVVGWGEWVTGFPKGSWGGIGSQLGMWVMLGVLTLCSTLFGYATMIAWQPRVSSVQAGLIYASEPVFATVWALFLPSWYSALSGITYANEVIGGAFVVGALAIVAANVLIALQVKPDAAPPGGVL
jgi:drug/metabolite transporter (DMT)-like permease